MRIAAGVLTADQGTITVDGSRIAPETPRQAARHGIAMVHQHFSSVPAFTAAENIALAASWPVLSRRALHRRVIQLSERVGLPLDPEARTEGQSVVVRQRIEILKALATGARILLFDEPTGALAPADARDLLVFIRRLADDGGSVVLITHRLDEALLYADRVTVLRRGRVVFTGMARDLDADQLTRHMLGHPAERPAPSELGWRGAVPAIEAAGVTLGRADARKAGVRSASFSVFPGEMVGIAAVEGSGQHELLRILAGLIAPDSGTLRVEEPGVFVPEDRTTEALIQEFSLADNLVLGFGRTAPWIHRGLLDADRSRQFTRDLLQGFEVKSAGPLAPAATLSGGNQQRFILGRALAQNPRVLLAEEPARGLDIAGAQMVYQRLRDAARSGAAVLLYSNDLDELLAWCDRLLVMADGRLSEVPAGSDQDTVGRMMLASVRSPA
jgi:simple sugar transport system ATP-binding protein